MERHLGNRPLGERRAIHEESPDSKRWILNVPQYGRVNIAMCTRGVELVSTPMATTWDTDLWSAHGADPKQVQVVFEGMKDVRHG